MAADRFDDLLARCMRLAERGEVEELEAVCAQNPEHAARVWSVVAAEFGVKSAADTIPPTEPDGSRAPSSERPATIGPYKILDQLGAGGMGVVYLGEQRHPVRRRVAVKVIKRGMDSESVLARFEAERQALALMEHAAIARIYDCGITDAGQPYFAMEYVKGRPITRYCDDHRLGIAQRLDLFLQVCAGVQHAHNKGVIHRDLTPNNVLVTAQEDGPRVKIIDFGLARATDHRLTEATVFTELGQFVGTPEYMSPEQAGLEDLDIDARSDVYTLGVLLYELLVGARPFRLRELGLAEMQRVIREQDPQRPSTRVSTVTKETAVTARARGADVRTLSRRLRGDLDWIVMRALEKDRTRRYVTPSELAADLRRHLDHEPVLAGPPGAGYRLRKLVRRYRLQFVAGLLLLASLAAGIVGTTWFMLDARRLAERAERARLEAKAQETLAKQQAERVARLAELTLVEEARREARSIVPAWPARIQALEDWERIYGEVLRTALPKVKAALAALESRALPRTEDEVLADRTGHPDFDELEVLQQRVPALRAAMAKREAGRADVVELPDDAPDTAEQLYQAAWGRVAWSPDERTIWGQEDLGLAYATRALAIADGHRHAYLDAYAWALFANGRDDDALAASEQALKAAPASDKAEYEDNLFKLNREVRNASHLLSVLEARLVELDREVTQRRTWRFADEADRILHTQMQRAERELTHFLGDDGTLRDVQRRRWWAERVDEATRHHPDAVSWSTARAAIGAADGTRASELYREVPIDLQPQTGLVPIGMNPQTKLWEFYHLRSAWDAASGVEPTAIPLPRHREDGGIDVTPETGIVFVLIPGATFAIGAQKSDPGARNYDENARTNERVRVVTIRPFFVSKYELTRAQWRRLTKEEDPSFYPLGAKCGRNPGLISPTHPVTRVTWSCAGELTSAHGLAFPFEMQWEHACRAGSTTPWYPGSRIEDLRGHANLADTVAHASDNRMRYDDALDDGWFTEAPVGSFAPNPFGLYDVHGNVAEWCSNDYSTWTGRMAPELSWVLQNRTYRGGSYASIAILARSALRESAPPSFSDQRIGLRPSRLVVE